MQTTVQNLKDHRVAREDRAEALAWLAASVRWDDRLDALEGHAARDGADRPGEAVPRAS